MSNTEYFANLILPVPLDQLFTYRVPDHLIESCAIGKRVVVQFGQRRVFSAIVREIHQNKPENIVIKEILDIIDEFPIVTDNQFKFWEWVSGYYMCSIGEVYKAALPAGLRLESATLVSYNSSFFEDEISNGIDVKPKESIILDALKDGKALNLDEINSILSIKNCFPVIKSLFDKGMINIAEELNKGFKPKTEKYITLADEYSNNEKLNSLFEKLKHAPKQSELLTHFIELIGVDDESLTKSVLLKVLLKKSQADSSKVNELVKKGVFKIQLKNISRFSTSDLILEEKFPLHEFQQKAFDQIVDGFNEKDTILLHGITSSGKTEIYIHLIQKFIEQGMQVLYLLPEIALTTQIIERLRRVFGHKVGVFHSKYSDAERVEVYHNVLGMQTKDNAEPYQVILGVRSAIFLPFRNLGLVIVDEEHESTYKQNNPAPRYQARDSSIVLAKFSGAKTLLGTATPSIESYYNSKTGKYGIVIINQRYKDILLPEILIADVKEARRKKQMKTHFTPVLMREMINAINQNEQVILFQNRRGFALYIECHECGWIPKCKYCDVSLTYHQHVNQLVCHYCGYARSVYKQCDNCNNSDVRTRGFGTEKVEEELKILFPDIRVKRLDLDSAKGKHAYANIIGDFEDGRIDVLVGTQMVTKGLDFDNVSLVGVLDANQMLNFPDFRAYERSYQLMAQVGGRAGRRNKQGKVVIQTISPENQIISQISKNDYESMFMMQLAERKQFNYPPFNRLVNITLKHKNKQTLDNASLVLANSLRKNSGLQVIGPEYPIISKIFDLYIKNILIKLDLKISIQHNKQFILDIGSKLLEIDEYKGVLMVYDVDPY
jgi:primosomal protein N' (replication factor Y)